MVNVKLKTLANKVFELEFPEDQTVADFKEFVSTETQIGKPNLLKLIHLGKILHDDQTAKSANIADNAFIVVMVSKKDTSAAAPVAASASAEEAPAIDPSPAPVSPPVERQAPAAAPVANTGLVQGAQYEAAVEGLMSLGFERDQVVRALQASFNNPDRAAEYLFSGIPDSLGSSAPEQQNMDQEMDMDSGNEEGVSMDMGQLQQLLHDRPELVEGLIQQIGQTNPQLMQVIGQNREAFLQMTQNPQMLAQILRSAGIGIQGSGGGAGGGGGQPPQNVIQVTEAERSAIERLEGLGFSRERVLEAFLACDRDEQVAANYLFENNDLDQNDD